jgi:hypothetical protein
MSRPEYKISVIWSYINQHKKLLDVLKISNFARVPLVKVSLAVSSDGRIDVTEIIVAFSQTVL